MAQHTERARQVIREAKAQLQSTLLEQPYIESIDHCILNLHRAAEPVKIRKKKQPNGKVLKDIDALLRNARALRNHCIPIAKLSSEIVALILVWVVEPTDPFNAVSWRQHHWLASVCSSWRKAALSCPAFWACLPWFKILKRCYTVVVQRSKVSFVTFRLTLNHGQHRVIIPPQRLAELLAPARLTVFHLKGNSLNLREVIRAFPQEAPLLRSLRLELGDKALRRIPIHLLSAPKPRLRHLELVACIIDWSSIQLDILPIEDLHTLRLKEHKHPLPSHLLMGLLRSSPNLQVLELSGVLAPGFDTVPINFNPLRHLRRYRIVDSLERIAHLTSAIHQTTSTVHIECTGDASSFTEEAVRGHVITILRSCYLTQEATPRMIPFWSPSSSLRKQHNTLPHLILSMSNPWNQLSFRKEGPEGRWGTYGVATMRVRFRFPVSRILMETLYAPSATSLVVQLPHRFDPFPRALWGELYARHPDIQELAVETSWAEGYKFREIISPLGTLKLEHDSPIEPIDTINREAFPEPHYKEQLLLPSLSMLRLRGVFFKAELDDRNDTLLCLQHTILDRVRHVAAPFTCLELERCAWLSRPMGHALSERLDKVGIELVWDGRDAAARFEHTYELNKPPNYDKDRHEPDTDEEEYDIGEHVCHPPESASSEDEE